MTLPVVTIDQMRDQLLTLDQLHGELAATEPLGQHTFPASNTVEVTIPAGALAGAEEDDSGAVLRTGADQEYALTRKCLLEAGASVGIPRGVQRKWPEHLERDAIRWWFRGGAGDREWKLLVRERPDAIPLALGMCRGTITPFSNVQLLETGAARIRERYGPDTEILADYKRHHDLELSAFRLIIPEDSRVIGGTRVEQDMWSAGLDFRNSLTGLKPTDISGYLFRYWCTNGCTDTLTSTGAFSRRGHHDDADVWEWAQRSVDEVLGGLEGTFEAVQALTQIPVEGNVGMVLQDLFAQYDIPVRERQRVIQSMADLGGDLTMYDVQAAITQAANAEGLSPRAVEQLLTMGGHVAHAATGRCNSCRRLLPDGYVAPAVVAGEVAAG